MQTGELKDWVWIVNTVITIVLMLGGWFLSRRKATSDEIQKVASSTNQRIKVLEDDTRTRLASTEKRLLLVEKSIEAMPTHEDLIRQSKAMERQTEKLDQLIGTMNARNKQTDVIYAHLLSGGDK